MMKTDNLELSDNNPIFINKNIKDIFQELYDHYRDVESRNEYLLRENTRLKNEAYKDEELIHMKNKYDEMYDAYHRGFPITKEQSEKINAWMNMVMEDEDDVKRNTTRFYYKFYPTSLGVAGYVVDGVTGEKFLFQELN